MLAAGCVESAPQTQLELGPSQEVQEMLDARADALAAGDVAGYLEPLDPAARDVEQPIAEQSQAVPLAEILLRLREATFASREIDGEQVSVADNAKVDVVFRYEGIPDDNPFYFRLRSDFEQRGGAWHVTDSEVVIPDAETPVPMPPMWVSGPVATARSEHFLALHRPGLEDPDGVLELAEQARSDLLPELTLEPAPTHVLQIAADDVEFGELRSPAGPQRGIAFASATYPDPRYARSRVPENRHMTVNLAAILADALPPGMVTEGDDAMTGGQPEEDDADSDHAYEPEVSPVEVFQHELGHLALSRFTRSSTPIWVIEGGAMQLAGEQRAASWRQGLDSGAFAEMSFLRLARRDPTMGLSAMEYAYVNAAVSSLVADFGAEQFWEFYRDFKDFEAGSAGNPLEQVHADATHRLLFRIYDIGEEQLDARALEWMRDAV